MNICKGLLKELLDELIKRHAIIYQWLVEEIAGLVASAHWVTIGRAID